VSVLARNATAEVSCRRLPCASEAALSGAIRVAGFLLHDGWHECWRCIGRWSRASHSIAQTRSLAEQLLRSETMTARHLRGDVATVAAFSCADHLRRRDARDHLDPPRMRSRRRILGVVTTVNTMVKTKPAHGAASCPAPTPFKVWGQSTALMSVVNAGGAANRLRPNTAEGGLR
jgi:hypothetical protein